MTPRDDREVQALLQRWSSIDEEVGRRAAQRRREFLHATGRPLTDYEFGERPNDWVHRDWMRPIRFVYRKIPTGLRMQLKKRLAK